MNTQAPPKRWTTAEKTSRVYEALLAMPENGGLLHLTTLSVALQISPATVTRIVADLRKRAIVDAVRVSAGMWIKSVDRRLLEGELAEIKAREA